VPDLQGDVFAEVIRAGCSDLLAFPLKLRVGYLAGSAIWQLKAWLEPAVRSIGQLLSLNKSDVGRPFGMLPVI
jgi:hypothetical protein